MNDKRCASALLPLVLTQSVKTCVNLFPPCFTTERSVNNESSRFYEEIFISG